MKKIIVLIVGFILLQTTTVNADTFNDIDNAFTNGLNNTPALSTIKNNKEGMDILEVLLDNKNIDSSLDIDDYMMAYVEDNFEEGEIIPDDLQPAQPGEDGFSLEVSLDKTLDVSKQEPIEIIEEDVVPLAAPGTGDTELIIIFAAVAMTSGILLVVLNIKKGNDEQDN